MNEFFSWVIERPFKTLWYVFLICIVTKMWHIWHSRKKEHQKTIDDRLQARISEIHKIEEAAEFLEFTDPKIGERELNLMQLARLMSFHKNPNCDDGIYEMLSEKASVRMAYLQHEYDRNYISPFKFENNEWFMFNYGTSMLKPSIQKLLAPIYNELNETAQPVFRALTLAEYEILLDHYKYGIIILHSYVDHELFQKIMQMIPYDAALHEGKSFFDFLLEQGQDIIHELEMKIDILKITKP
jgi:hypothetical protein